MAIGDIKKFKFIQNGLELDVTAIDLGGTTKFVTRCLTGHIDINSIYWNDGDSKPRVSTFNGVKPATFTV